MAVCPGGVPAHRSAAVVEAALLGQQDKRLVGVLAVGYGALTSRNLLQRATNMNRTGAVAIGVSEGMRPSSAQSILKIPMP
jgi:hypothetical protein